MSSYDITPPLTPDPDVGFEEMDQDWYHYADEEVQVDQNQIVSKPFSCQSERNRVLNAQETESREQQLSRFLKQTDTDLKELGSVQTELFGYSFPSTAFMDHIEKISLFLRQWMAKVQNSFMVSGQEIHSLRQDVINFFEYLKTFLLSQQLERQGCLLSHVHNCLIYLDQISQIQYEATSMKDSREYHNFHLCLDVYCKVLEVLHLITTKNKDVSYSRRVSRSMTPYTEEGTVFTQVLHLVMWELCTVGFAVHRKTTTRDYLSCTPFICSCVKETWSLIWSLIRHRDKQDIEEPFWVHMHYIFQALLDEEPVSADMEIDTDVYLYPPKEKFKGDNSDFCIWMMTHLATCIPESNPLKVTPESNYHGLMIVLKKCLAKENLSEGELRFYLQCLAKLTEVWEPSMDPLIAFWDYFCPRLNNKFQLNTGSVEGLATVSQTSSALLELCNRLGNGQYQYKSSDTSLHIFLGVLGRHLHSFYSCGSTSEWRQFKGRVFMRFHKRRMQELSDNGLYNFSLLIVCLGQVVVQDVTKQFLNLIDMLDSSGLKTGKTRIIWMTLFVLFHLHQQKGLDTTVIADRLGKAFSVAAIEFSTSDDFDPGHRHQLWKLLQFYLESLQFLFESTSNVEESQHMLITDGFLSLINSCRRNELACVLSTVHTVIAKVRQYKKIEGLSTVQLKYLQDLYSALWKNVQPAVKAMSSSLTAPDQIADAMAGLCLMVLDSESTECAHIVKFMLGGSVNKSLCCRFWCHILPVEGVVSTLSKTVPNFQTSLIQTWISCTIFVSAASQQLTTFNSCMMNICEVVDIMKQSGTSQVDNASNSCLQFVKALDLVYAKIEVWKDRITFRDRTMAYFSDIPRQVTPVVQTMKAGETLTNVYAAVGFIVKSCAQMLFVQSKPDCPLPNLINSMIVPHFLYKQDKTVNPVFLNVIRDYLHLFVRGLGRLNYKTTPYVQRKLGDIVTMYLPKFWTTGMAMGTASAVHPLVVALKKSFVRQPAESELTFRQFIFEIVVDKFLKPQQGTLPLNHAQALLFIKEITTRSASKESIARDCTVLLDHVLTVMAVSKVLSTQQCAQQIVCQLMEAAVTHSSILPENAVGDTLSRYLTFHQKTNLDGAIKTLEKVSKSGPTLIKKILPTLQHIIVQHELYRGSGRDGNIRQTYLSLRKAVGAGMDDV